MKGLIVPDVEEDFTADPVELFFDLAFVFAFSRIVWLLVHHPTWTGAGEAAMLFVIIWMIWSIFTWSANAVSGNNRIVRLVFVIATAVTVPMAASVQHAYDSGGVTFALSGAVIIVMGLALGLVAHDRDSDVFRSALRFGWPNLLAIVFLVAGGLTGGGLRVILWLLVIVVIVVSTIMAGSGSWIVRSGHFAERHGLILIIALGEVIVAIGIAVTNSLDEGGLDGSTRYGLLAAGLLAGLLWWAYFDRPLPALEYGADQQASPQPKGRYARDVYTYLHAPIIGGVIVAAAATEEALLHPSDPLDLPFRVMLASGLVLFEVGIAGAVFRAFRVLAWERLAAVALIAVIVISASSFEGVTVLIIVDAVLMMSLLLEGLRFRHNRQDEPAEVPAAV